MREINKKIKELRVENTEKKIVLKELKDTIKNYEKSEYVKISDEKDENFKPKFSNETKRESELSQRLGVDGLYQQMIKQVKDFEKEIDLKQIEIDYLTWEMTLSGHRNDDIVDAINKISEVLKK